MGTALVKCLSYVDDIQVVYEPCVSAYHYGPDADIAQKAMIAKFMDNASANPVDSENAFYDSTCTYGWVKQQLETDYPGKKILLAKDQAQCLNTKYDMLPSGFRYAFLIRHPYRVWRSWKPVITRILNLDINAVSLAEVQKATNQPDWFAMQCNLLKYVKENLDPNVFVIDADDLQSNPSSILSQFCQGVGIQYNASLLKWPSDRDIMKTWKMSRISLQGNYLENEGGFYEVALKSTQFLPPKPLPKRSELPKDIQEVADKSMQFYKQMREMCLKP
ncbi:uncharacterized protein [Amphiura filiformis]|uniref:uncharacterized protein n=1 Tax=Amphiura filiformis TaxID=82378 RepID=UPI003B21FBF1